MKIHVLQHVKHVVYQIFKDKDKSTCYLDFTTKTSCYNRSISKEKNVSIVNLLKQEYKTQA